MKKIFLIISALLISASVSADVNWRCLKSHCSDSNLLFVKDGKHSIEVSTLDNSTISCQFIDVDGKVGLEQKNTKKCFGTVNLVMPWHIQVKVTNNSNHNTMYRVIIRD